LWVAAPPAMNPITLFAKSLFMEYEVRGVSKWTSAVRREHDSLLNEASAQAVRDTCDRDILRLAEAR
jgi:hypothetical protein